MNGFLINGHQPCIKCVIKGIENRRCFVINHLIDITPLLFFKIGDKGKPCVCPNQMQSDASKNKEITLGTRIIIHLQLSLFTHQKRLDLFLGGTDGRIPSVYKKCI